MLEIHLGSVQNPSIIPLNPGWLIGIPRSWIIIAGIRKHFLHLCSVVSVHISVTASQANFPFCSCFKSSDRTSCSSGKTTSCRSTAKACWRWGTSWWRSQGQTFSIIIPNILGNIIPLQSSTNQGLAATANLAEALLLAGAAAKVVERCSKRCPNVQKMLRPEGPDSFVLDNSLLLCHFHVKSFITINI